MSKFRIGDEVIRAKTSKVLIIGKKYTVVGIDTDGWLTLKGEEHTIFDPSYFELYEDTSKHHVHHDLIIAWAKGAKIEYLFDSYGSTWKTMNSPSWSSETQYRIKPEPCPEKEELTSIIADMKEQLAEATKRLEELE